MSKINWILNSQITSQPRMRDVFIRFLETKFNIDNEVNSLDKLPLNRIFNSIGNFKTEICEFIFESKALLSFEHNVNDKKLQKLIFLFLKYTQQKFPDRNSWEIFLAQSMESQEEEISQGIQTMWLDMQRQNIQNEMNNDIR
jgi:hypothetical protein